MTLLSPPIPRLFVVAGLIVNGPKVLVTQRREDQSLPLEWEFPGGKVEPGEAPAAALRRELSEEIGCVTDVGQVWDVLHHVYEEFELIMLVYLCRLVEGDPFAREVADLRWVTSETARGVAILDADRPLIARLAREGVPPFRK